MACRVPPHRRRRSRARGGVKEAKGPCDVLLSVSPQVLLSAHGLAPRLSTLIRAYREAGAKGLFVPLSIFRRSGHRFAAENATNAKPPQPIFGSASSRTTHPSRPAFAAG